MRSPGPIALLGGGEHLGPTVPLDRRLMELSGATRPVVVILPQAPAKGQLAMTVALARNYWARMGVDVRIALPELDPVRAEVELMEADIAVIPGGHPNKLIGGLGASPLTDLMVSRWLDGSGPVADLPRRVPYRLAHRGRSSRVNDLPRPRWLAHLSLAAP